MGLMSIRDITGAGEAGGRRLAVVSLKTLLTNESPATRCEVLSTHIGRRLSWHILVRVSRLQSATAGEAGRGRWLAGGDGRRAARHQPGDRRTSGSAATGPMAWPGSRTAARDRTARRAARPTR